MAYLLIPVEATEVTACIPVSLIQDIVHAYQKYLGQLNQIHMRKWNKRNCVSNNFFVCNPLKGC